MLSISDIFRAQSKYGISNVLSNTEKVSYDMYLLGCRRAITDKTPLDYYNWDKDRQKNYTENLIKQYVIENLKDVEGYMDENNDVDQTALTYKLNTDIVDFGVLRDALEDDDVQEIQINDYRTIWVVKRGKSYLYTDKNGKPYQFVSDVELTNTIDRLIYNPDGNIPRMTTTSPLLNTRTAQRGYRLSAVNNSAVTRDMKVGFEFPVTCATIRKYAPSMLTFEDFIKSDTLCEEEADFLRLCGNANVKLVCVGPTSSGKTTLLNAIVWCIKRSNRIILVQNPTEIMLYERSEETGTNLRNVLHWEASEVDVKYENDPSSPTMSHFIEHSLRNTPDIIIPGELRTPKEFFQWNRAMKTGHIVLSTFHADGGKDAIDRAGTELSSFGGSYKDHLSTLVKSLDIVVSQKKLADGSRHVMAIEELTGDVCSDGTADTRVLFRYNLTGDVDTDSNGDIKKIYGYFEQVNPISERLLQKFYEAGVSRKQLLKFIDIPKTIEGKSNLVSQKNKNLGIESNDLSFLS